MSDKEKFTQHFEDRAGFQADYRGRWFYNGPALAIDGPELQDIIKESPVKLQLDELGLGWIVYPAK